MLIHEVSERTGLSQAPLRGHLGDRASKAPTREVEGEPVPVNEFDVSRDRTVLGWDPRPSADTIIDTVASLQRFGLVQGLSLPR